jgi:hypothetical protein
MIEFGQSLVGKAMPMTGVNFISYKSQYLGGIRGKIASGEQGGRSFGPTAGNGVVEVGFGKFEEQIALCNPFKVIVLGMDNAIVKVKPFGSEFETEVAAIAESENVFRAVGFTSADRVGISIGGLIG